MIRYFIHNGVAVTVMGLAIVMFGILALVSVPIQLTPDVTSPAITVNTFYPGANPEDIEQDILIEQEEYLRNLPGLQKMTSTASLGQGTIELEFEVGSDMSEKLVRVNNALSQVSGYPENVDQPSLSTSSASDQPVAWFGVRAVNENGQPVTDILDHYDWMNDVIKPQFERISGVSEVRGVYGGSDRQLQIFIDPIKLAERGISIYQVRSAIRDNNRDMSGGDLNEGKRRYNIRTLGRIRTAAEAENRIITERDGTPIRIRDVGYARIGLAEQRSLIRHNGEQALAFGVVHQSGTNLLVVMEQVKQLVKELNEGPMKQKGIYMKQVTDDTEYIRESVAMVQSNLIIGGVLAFLSLLVFLRNIRSTIVLGISIPLSIMGALFMLSASGRSINVISLAGLAFSIGAVLDSSIVVLENIYRHRVQKENSFLAAEHGTTEVWTAIFASMTTNLVVFIPIITLKEQAGQLFRDIAIAITYANIMAFLVSIFIIPALTARLLKKMPKAPQRGFLAAAYNLFGVFPIAMGVYNSVGHFLSWLMRGVIRRLVVIVTVIGIAVLLIFALMPQTEYLPEGNQNSIFGLLIPPQGYNLEEMSATGNYLEKSLLPYVRADVEDFEEGRIDGPPMQDFFFVAFGTQMFTFTRAKDPGMANEVPGLLRRYFSQVPGMFGITMQRSIFADDISGSRALDLDIIGTDYPTITGIAFQAFMKVNQKMGGAQARPIPGIEIGQPQLTVTPDWARAAELGVSAQAIGYGAWVLGDGAYVDDFYENGQKRDVYMYSTLGAFDTLTSFDTLRFATDEGVTVPLAEVADVQFEFVPEQIRRVDQRRAVTLSITPPMNISLEEAIEILERDVIAELKAEGAVPEGYELEIAGASDKLAAILHELLPDFILAGALVYLTLVLIFRHWGHPLTIMMSIPIGLTGGILGLKFLNLYLAIISPGTIQSLDVLTMLGFVILLGSIVNNPILIVEQSLNFMREDKSDPHKAIVAATLSRIRPMLMTTTTTVFGLMPLVLIPGAGTEIYRGLGAVMFGGLFLGTITTLIFIPCVMSLLVDFGRRAAEVEHRFEEKVLHIEREPEEKEEGESDRPRP